MSGTVGTHVLDAVTGTPAVGVPVRLCAADGTTVASGVTDADGRIRDLATDPRGSRVHRLVFDTAAWFREAGRDSFFPEVVITFEVAGDHTHVPLLLSPFAYSTYRGS